VAHIAIPNNMSKGRAGSRKVRVYVFREWLLRTYGSYLSQEIIASEDGGDGDGDDAGAVTVPEDPSVITATGCQPQSSRKRKRKRPGGNGIVLDVAGGKGDLSWLLKNVDGLESIVLDPWKPDPNNNSVSRNERMVRSIEYLQNNPEETRKRSVPGLLTFQPLAGLLPRLLEERTKRLQHHGDNEASLSSSSLSSSLFVPSSQKADSGVEKSLDNGNADGPCCPEDFLTPRILHVPLDEIMVQKVRNRIMDNAKMEAGGGNFTDGYDNYDVDKGKQDTRTDDPTHEDDGILDLLSSGRIKLIVGFHPDQATEPCIDLARVLGIPYCVVPCCVFPAEFPNRRLRLAPLPSSPSSSSSSSKDGNSSDKDGNNNPNSEHKEEKQLVPVRTYQQFLDYLRIKATTSTPATSAIGSDNDASPISTIIHTAYLDFPFTETAKNIVLYTLPPSHPHADSSAR
jgi:hypothetical protein